jgi:hypothetical protein
MRAICPILNTLCGLLDGFERAALLDGLPADQVAAWLRSALCSIRRAA